MATKSQEILLKGNTTNASAVPSSLKVREIAINALDRSLFTNDGNSIVKLYTGTTKWFDVNGNANNALKLGGVLASEYIGKEAFNTHTNNTTIHITSDERTAWNNKWDYNEETIKAVKVNAAVSADNAAKVGGFSVTSGNSKPWGTIPAITNSGYMDVGKHFEFHYDNTTGSDYSTALFCTGNYGNTVNLPSTSGTLALLTDNVASATKLATARKIWGQSFDGSADVRGNLYLNSYKLVWLSNENYSIQIADSGKASYKAYWGQTFYTKGVERLTITSDGDILIGTTTEKGYKLDVNGKGHYSGDLICGGEIVAVVGEGTPAGVTDYSALTGKPQINGVTLVSGNNTLASLGIQAAGDYATNSEVTTLLAEYATKTFVANNYAGKSAFNNHTADTDIHITSAERTAWNNKWDYNEATIKKVKVTSALSADSVAWSGIKDKPSTFTPSAHTHTASEISGLPTKLSAFTNDVGYVSVRQKDGYSYNNLYTLYQSGISSLYRIDLTNVQVNIWTMLFIEVSLKQHHTLGYAGKIFIHLYHGSTSDFNAFNATILGNLNNINVYSSDRRYIYISASMSYSTISVDRVLVGDFAINVDLSNIKIEKVDSLPDTYQTATIYNGLHTGNFTKSLVEGVLTGNITSHTHSYLPLSGGIITGPLVKRHTGQNYITFQDSDGNTYGYLGFNGANAPMYIPKEANTIYTLLHSGNYNSYAPTLTGTGASGTWGISITGNAAGLKYPDGGVRASTLPDGGVRFSHYITFAELPNLICRASAFSASLSANALLYSAETHYFVANNKYAMFINSSGNVTIGARDLASTTTKLYVNGTGHYAGDLIVDGEVSALVA